MNIRGRNEIRVKKTIVFKGREKLRSTWLTLIEEISPYSRVWDPHEAGFETRTHSEIH